MEHRQEHALHHKKEREQEKKQEKQAEQQAEKTRPILHPAWVIAVGIALVCLIILTWTFLL